MWRRGLLYAPIAIGLLLLSAGLYKLLHPGEAMYGLLALDFNPRVAQIAVFATIVAELYLGTILVFRIDTKYALAACMLLFLIFTCYLSYLSMLANPPSCGCLGLTAVFQSNRHNALLGLARNCAILWLIKLAYDAQFDQRGQRQAAGEARTA